LQRAIGNQALQRMLQTNAQELEARLTGAASPHFGHDFSRMPIHPPATGAIQTKLEINQPGDDYEQEADRVAERVMRMLEPQRQGACACGGECPRCRTEQPGRAQEHLQTKRVGSGDLGDTAVPPFVQEVLRSPGRPLDLATRALMEPRFGHHFAKVRVHTNYRAAESAEAMNALAYTVGNNIVFGAGQYVLTSSRGQRLLAHELAHVVQQNGGQTLQGEFAGRHDISRAPTSLISRKVPDPVREEQEKKQAQKNEEAKKEAVKRHVEQQRRVADLLDKARKIQPDPKKGLRDPDNLFHNTVGLLDSGRLTLTILSPTHYAPDRHFDSRYRFDAQGNQSMGGDYPADPRVGGPGIVWEANPPAGKINIPRPSPGIQTLPKKTEHTPGELEPKPERTEPKKTEPTPTKAAGQPAAPPPFSPSNVYFFTRGLDITEGDFKNTFVHEAQHVADLSPKSPTLGSWSDILEAYKSEFRAFWIQPPRPRVGALAPESIDILPEPTGKADNSRKVTISQPAKCTICPAPEPSAKAGKSAFAEPKTDMKNPRQEQIFWYILSHYQGQEYDCCYVYNETFHKEVNRFAYPESVNLINSPRLMDLNLELQNLNKSMTLSQVSGTKFVVLLAQLEPLDWAFLNDPKLSKPFWNALTTAAPGFLYKGVKALVKKGSKDTLSAAEVNKALAGK
jgi:Domain of unknown function (DUF4157)